MDNSSPHGVSRRRVMQWGTASIGAAVLGATTPTAAFADADGAGEDGAPAGDRRFAQKFDAAIAAEASAAAADTSYNGWTVGTPGSAIGVASFTVPGTSISIPVRSGDVAVVLMYVAGRFHAEVEALRSGQVWGYDYRKNVNNPSVWSNHASGTAIDLNSALHANGKKNTFSGSQVSTIRDILSVCGPVIYWGGDYSGTTDEMHFEIDVPPGNSQLPALASRIQGVGTSFTLVSLRSRANGKYVTAENGGASAMIANRSTVGLWEQFDMADLGGGNVALRSRANKLYACAESGGTKPVITNRLSVGDWETFALVRNGDGTVSLRARANNRYVCAENGGASPILANRSAVGLWESFDLIS